MSDEDRLKAEWSRSDQADIEDAINALLQHRNGRRFLWWLLQIGKWGTQPYARNALDTAFSCGSLNVGQQVLDRILEVSPEGFIRMMEESNGERAERDAALTDARANANASTEPDPGAEPERYA